MIRNADAFIVLIVRILIGRSRCVGKLEMVAKVVNLQCLIEKHDEGV
jgi:hypothetical protein